MNFGVELMGDDKSVIAYRIEQSLNPNSLPPGELGRQRYTLTPKQGFMADLAACADEGFYISRTTGGGFDKIYYATKAELMVLIRDHIDDDEFQGLDLTVANEDFTWVFVTSHDGDIYKMR
jgi:hypothetical protein